mmetsp:Transcript_10795/g.12137  ORF Transcript_10795/g.12137 Transcript_10795/m.12137 type:complete len:240 (+) Transcript_10795:66-785(+)
MALIEQSVLDEKKYDGADTPLRPTSTIIVDAEPINNSGQLQQNNNTTEAEAEAIATATIDITKSVSEDEKHLVKEAGQGGAVLGFVVGGPIGSALLGFGSAYAIRKPKDSTIGKASRSLANLTVSVKEKAKGVEEEHHFVKRSKATIGNICGDNNDNEDVVETRNDDDNNNDNETGNKNIAFKTRALAVSSWKAASKFTKDNQVIERGVEGTGKGIEYLDGAISNLRGKKDKSATEKQE